MASRARLMTIWPALLAAVALVLAGCGGADEDTPATDVNTTLRGDIVVDGSSTVAPLTQAAADAFTAGNPLVSVEVRVSGTGGGFEVFCRGETDISNASRRISPDEVTACREAGIEYETFRVGSDGITVVTRRGADVGTDCLSLEELRRVWIRGSRIDNWRQIDPRWADAPLTLAGPGVDSGTYDFFNERVLGEGPDGETLPARTGDTASENDEVIVAAVEAAPSGMGYFGYSYYAANEDRLTPFALDAGNGEGCIPVSVATINSGDYPLARPLFIYVNRRALDRPEVVAFVRSYLENDVAHSRTAGTVPAPRIQVDQGVFRLDRLTGR